MKYSKESLPIKKKIRVFNSVNRSNFRAMRKIFFLLRVPVIYKFFFCFCFQLFQFREHVNSSSSSSYKCLQFSGWKFSSLELLTQLFSMLCASSHPSDSFNSKGLWRLEWWIFKTWKTARDCKKSLIDNTTRKTRKTIF